jgi:hypothetical protein
MGRRKKPVEQRRVKLNLTIHPDIREWADEISRKRRRSISQLLEDLVEMEWMRLHPAPPSTVVQPPLQQQAYYPPQPYPYHYPAQQTRTTPAGN